MIRRILIAIQFMTVFRLVSDLAETEEDMASSVAYYPLVGLLLGGLLALCGYVFGLFLPVTVSAFLLTIALIFFTNGLHLDGLADTADGIFSHRDRETKLIIMKDSRVGVFGALALILGILAKVIFLNELASDWKILLLFPVWGRAAVSMTTCLGGYARAEGGLGRAFIDKAGKRELLISLGISLILTFLILGPKGLIILLITILASLLALKFWQNQLGGVTGDILGAVIEMGEILSLFLAVIIFA